MCRDRDVVVLDNQIAHGSRRHVEAQRLPVFAIVEGDIDGALRSGEKQAFPLRVFADDVHGLSIRNSPDDFLPGFPGVVRSIDMRTHIVEPEGVDRGVSRLGIEMSGIDEGDFLPGRNCGGVTSVQFFPPSLVS